MRILYLTGTPRNITLVNRLARVHRDEVIILRTVDEALKDADARSCDVIITEVAEKDDLFYDLSFVNRFQDNGISVPVIVLTSSEYDEYERSSFASGCDIHITRPGSPFTLMRLIDRLR